MAAKTLQEVSEALDILPLGVAVFGDFVVALTDASTVIAPIRLTSRTRHSPPGVSADNFAERTVELHLDWMTLRRPDGHWAVMAAPGAGRESYLAAAFACALARASVRSASPT
jgi:hypothetical protein